MDNQENKQLSLELKPDVARGNYSNLAIISHSPTEFTLDFATILPGFPKAEVCSRIIMNPVHAKRLLNALQDNISKYEDQYGKIQLEGIQRGTFNLTDFAGQGGTKS